MNAPAAFEHSISLPKWHLTMLRDEARNYAIESCISNLTLTGKTVVEIGTGAGLPAMLFAKYGAEKVVTIEMDVRIAEVARTVIQANGYGGRVEVIAKPSWEAIDAGEVPFNPDIIFTETLDCGVVGEGYESVARDVRRLAGPETLVLPEAIHQFGFLSHDVLAYEKNTVFTQCGFDLSHLNDLSAQPYYSINQFLHTPAALSAKFLFREYDYRDETCLNRVTRFIIASDSGLCHGVTSFFQARFGDFVVSSENKSSHWAMAFHPLSNPILVEKGRRYRLSLQGNGLITISN